MMKAPKDVSKIHMKSTSTRAPVAEPSLFISKKAKGKSENHVEEFKKISDSLPIFDECEEELIENLMSCEESCDLPCLEFKLILDNEQTIVELTVLQPEHPSSLVLSPQVFEEEPLNYPHQRPRLDTIKPLDEDLGPIFDKEDEPGPVFDEEATNITSIAMESHLCFDPGTTPAPLSFELQENLFVLSIQEREVQPLRNERIDRAQQPEIWRSFVVQTGYFGDASNRGLVQNGYLNIQNVFCHESNFLGNPTHQGFTEAWNHLKSFTEEGVMNFRNRRFSSLFIREYQTSKGNLGPRNERPEPKWSLNEPKVFPQSTSCLNQNHCKDHGLIVSAHHENVLKSRISKRNHIFTWLKNDLFKPFHDLFSLSCALKEIWCRKKDEPKLLRPKNHFDLVHDEKFSKLTLSHSFANRFTTLLDFEISKPLFGTQFTCLMFTHVLDDYPKGLDPNFDVLRIEKPFDYFFRRFDVVSLVVLKVQDIKEPKFTPSIITNNNGGKPSEPVFP
ncbi:hypothetical protein F2Q70_00038089 [Brassica cretica]|uniref:Uncharacterized protein n=1 Tax=Brassica cretica TaxID=69181 RepID=A0A8S9KAQ9_BRACR|nr:hypothetical protein F2Q70_00038089 [Brassica cretica]